MRRRDRPDSTVPRRPPMRAVTVARPARGARPGCRPTRGRRIVGLTWRVSAPRVTFRPATGWGLVRGNIRGFHRMSSRGSSKRPRTPSSGAVRRCGRRDARAVAACGDDDDDDSGGADATDGAAGTDARRRRGDRAPAATRRRHGDRPPRAADATGTIQDGSPPLIPTVGRRRRPGEPIKVMTEAPVDSQVRAVPEHPGRGRGLRAVDQRPGRHQRPPARGHHLRRPRRRRRGRQLRPPGRRGGGRRQRRLVHRRRQPGRSRSSRRTTSPGSGRAARSSPRRTRARSRSRWASSRLPAGRRHPDDRRRLRGASSQVYGDLPVADVFAGVVRQRLEVDGQGPGGPQGGQDPARAGRLQRPGRPGRRRRLPLRQHQPDQLAVADHGAQRRRRQPPPVRAAGQPRRGDRRAVPGARPRAPGS